MSNANDFVIENGVLEKYVGPGGDVVIPAGVTAIGQMAFRRCKELTSVVIPTGVVVIEYRAFDQCDNLRRITIPQGLEKIEFGAFFGCTHLEELIIPKNVTQFGTGAFCGCKGLANEDGLIIINGIICGYCGSTGKLRLPKDMPLADGAFCQCKELTSVILPEGMTSIGYSMFNLCENLVEVSLPETLTSIEEHAFAQCFKLTAVTLPKGLKAIKKRAFAYCENLRTVVIPEGITAIEEGTFHACKKLESVTILGSVAVIKDNAFSGCKKLASVTMSNGSIQLGDDVFSECNALFNKDGLLILNGVLLAYAGKAANIIVPEGVTCIGRKAFSYTVHPETISLPASLASIEDSAFESCMCLQSVTVKSSKIIFGTSVFANCRELKNVVLEAIPSAEFNLSAFPNKAKMILPPHVLETKELLPPTLAKRMEIKSPEEYAYVAVYQTAKQWADICKLAEKYAVDALPYIARFLSEEVPNMTPAKAKQLVTLVKEKKEKADRQVVDSILSSLKDWATNAGAKAVLKEIGQSDAPQKKHPIELYVDKELEKCWLNPDVQKVVKKGIPYADGSGISSEKAVSLLLAEYQRRWVQTATLIQGDMGQVEVLENINLITISEVADNIAAALDRQKLLAFLRQLAHGANYRLFILAYARFADEAEMETFIKEISQKLRSAAKDRYWAKNAQQAMYLSETTAAIRYIDRYGKLGQYAMIHNVDANTLRIERLYDLGMDEHGKKVYDLGGKNLAVQLLPDLTLQLYDENAGKIVKSVPKAGSDERKYNAAKEDIAKLKKDIKEIRDTQFEQLFRAFLDGTGKRVADWERFYQSNPILRQIAELVVWAQGADTFTLRAGNPINSAGQEYVLTECMVTLAHPMEMGAAEVTAWQGYFAANQIKQPFNQIWEPVIDFRKVTSDRYIGVEIPAYRFKGQEKHGITFQFDYGSSDLEIGLTDCTLYLTGGTAICRHSLDIQGNVQLYTFQVRQESRASNHIIGLLDKWAVYSRILKDDASIADQLPQFTLAQIEEFLKLAMENNCTNCTAALLEFKNANFAGFDPMAEFTLEL